MIDITTSEMVRTLVDRAEIADTLYRFAAGLDDADPVSLRSALTEDAVVDFSPASKIGIDFIVLTPREVIVESAMSSVGPMDTSHNLSNIRSEIDGDSAHATCSALAQHFPGGTGPNPNKTIHALMMNRYDINLVRDGATWRISRLTIDNIWFEGDTAVLRAIP